ncbi:MAG: hypothetical protein GY820_35015 [Gammaproteobacteria bacterium]|nr:hypothetical protein [Gammaproteobacteria bacterium]
MTTTKTRTQRVKEQAISNIEFAQTNEGWGMIKDVLSMAAFDMNKKERKEFFEVMKDENKKREFLTYLITTTSLEAAMIQQQ